MKAIVHVGMHKTGSSSIQDTFSRLDDPGFEYVDYSSPNHCGMFVLLFEDEDKLARYHGFRSRGPEFTRSLPSLRAEWRARLEEQLSRAGDRTVVFSAEDISAPPFRNAARRLRDFFARWTDDISVIGYARPPAGFITSAFQQRLKGGGVPQVLQGGASPRYRARFEKIDSIFGRQRVRLKEYAPSRLVQGDVVQDFARETGIAAPVPGQVVRANESLGLEAVALLYLQRSMGRGMVSGFDMAQRVNASFISRLATIGNRRFAFSPEMIGPALARDRDDIAWMEDRLGHGFSEAGEATAHAVSSLDDLVDIALDQFDAVQNLLGPDEAVTGPATAESLVLALERLGDQCRREILSPGTGSRGNAPGSRQD